MLPGRFLATGPATKIDLYVDQCTTKGTFQKIENTTLTNKHKDTLSLGGGGSVSPY